MHPVDAANVEPSPYPLPLHFRTGTGLAQHWHWDTVAMRAAILVPNCSTGFEVNYDYGGGDLENRHALPHLASR